ncbi:conserved hypothetical protein [Talaromyces stipitatus ATCC 10500]|uniref:P-loop containing nucleoside triphosphate hydrolase protein n=1 Tax=Talaromyces stipitatus (strain ATCC 10500 / CBS 375.48 / QM 6759 / NRRL 1006) TaxID=441959 RepID=B8M1S9_TALSN|nr:uncharacterized protein TSTA_094120 [Talaromyces stipitatus ATCC 10500]EED22166.1 conserved hypothetical protein [Talaromyces stipitatus ATCC 10500]
MSAKPIFVATHPRACSTAFERVFMTRRDSLQCIHEPFGDAFYFGPERLSARYENDEKARLDSGFSTSTYKTIFDRIESETTEGKRIFIKDIIHYLVPPDGKPASIAPSLFKVKRGIGTNGEINGLTNGHAEVNGVTTNGGTPVKAEVPPYPYPTEAEPGNPTVVPLELLSKFHFTFLIRDPHYSIPSYFRCTIPPLDDVTGFHEFSPSEAGYDEVRRVFDYLRSVGLIGPRVATTTHAEDTANKQTNGTTHRHDNGSMGVEICVIDADDLLDNPSLMIESYCKSVGIPFEPEMLRWDTEEDHAYARAAFEKWKGFHEDAIASKELKARTHSKSFKSEEEFDAEWREKFGEKGAKIIRETVNRNMADYHYMKHFALKV